QRASTSLLIKALTLWTSDAWLARIARPATPSRRSAARGMPFLEQCRFHAWNSFSKSPRPHEDQVTDDF
ncbi:MAG: hypothetical protein WCR06_05800, partial [bacterium]